LGREYWDVEYLEITTQIGCPVNCLKYCPQEVTIRRYSGRRKLALNDWEIILSHCPKELPIVFSGFCEPFANNQTIDLIDMAHKKGHALGIYTTLYQASHNDVEKLVKYPFQIFCLHLPDGGAMKIPLSQEYKDNVFTVLQKVKNVHFSIMNDLFEDNNREKITRGIRIKRKPYRFCAKLDHPQLVMLPNGNVSLCCMDFGLSQMLGNLLFENYVDVRGKFAAHKRTFELCSQCYYNVSPLRALASFMKRYGEEHLHLSLF
jgi:organic radical activating enzyme